MPCGTHRNWKNVKTTGIRQHTRLIEGHLFLLISTHSTKRMAKASAENTRRHRPHAYVRVIKSRHIWEVYAADF